MSGNDRDPDLLAQWLLATRAQSYQSAIAQQLHPVKVPPVLWHECADGHRWRQQPDGGVSPSYALAGSSFKFTGWDPARCPEPPRIAIPDDHGLARGIRCPGCGAERLPHDLLPGITSAPWERWREFETTGHVHQPPPPVCGKPPVSTRAFENGRWVPVVDGLRAEVGAQLALL